MTICMYFFVHINRNFLNIYYSKNVLNEVVEKNGRHFVTHFFHKCYSSSGVIMCTFHNLQPTLSRGLLNTGKDY